MGFFGELKEDIKENNIKLERKYIDSIKGEYVASEFKISGEKYVTTQLYPQIAEYANNHNLEIIDIGKPEVGTALHTRIAVMFKKQN